MTLITKAHNPAEVLPDYFTNSGGSASWAGRKVNELSGLEVIAILQLCRTEGWRQGWNDAQNNQVGAQQTGPFHAALLDGFPSEEWERSYLRGVLEQQTPDEPDEGCYDEFPPE
ncbi:hypothetical protein APB26_32745 [Pseudomonas aeruginosa]|uniref:hypothetical protein n=1 Tax=Pseudomonas aeruginosa TaxID=287 RepID=UPI00071BB611|nr:hypothetical protein [Pseudomonas aeruginosa]KSQ21751.1 hypothetical protein APB26_32745 [Pseudomonas aeruginosa]RPV61424.1 hypothetical protein IPC838_19085 [Pseudomonas aeruginosa]